MEPRRYNRHNNVDISVQLILPDVPDCPDFPNLFLTLQQANHFQHAPLFTRASFGLLVRLGFDVTVFTPASYLRHRL